MEKTRHFPVIIEQDRDGVYIVECSIFEGCRSYGETVEEALDNIREAIAVCMEEYDTSETATTFLGVRDIALAV
jgi:predicted RNase H-like HicB family nuclease